MANKEQREEPSNEESKRTIPTEGIPEFDRRSFLKATGVVAVLGTFSASTVTTAAAPPAESGKTRVTIYTEEERKNARENVQEFDWATERRDEAVSKAETVVKAYSNDQLWTIVTSQAIPRLSRLGPGISYQGDWHEKYTLDGFSYAPQPPLRWKVTNGEWTLPTNDFEAYRQSGLDDAGEFDPSLADDSLLTNELYPDKPDDFGVDDGTGFVDQQGRLGEKGATWTPVAWFNHWNIFYGFREMLVALRDAYIFTEDVRYSRAGTIILDRFADIYPEMEYPGGPYDLGYGNIINEIWESYWIKAVLRSYDGFFPGQVGDDELVSFLSNKATQYDIGNKSSIDQIRTNIETNVVRRILPEVKAADIRGNFGSHQATLAISAVLLDEPEGYTKETIDFVFQAGELENVFNDKPRRVTGGDVLARLVGSVDRDGHGYESSVHYNSDVVTAAVKSVADVLNGYDAYEGADLYENVKFKRMLYSHYPMVMIGDYMPTIGDTQYAGRPGFSELIEADNIVSAYEEYVLNSDEKYIESVDENYPDPVLAERTQKRDGNSVTGLSGNSVTGPSGSTFDVYPATIGDTTQSNTDADHVMSAYENYQDPVLAQWAYKLNGDSVDGLRGSIFDENPTAIRDSIQSVIDAEGPLDLDSTNRAGYGFTALRDESDGSNENDENSARGVWTYFGRNAYGPDEGYGTSHTHHDTLNLGIYAHQLDLTPELGYPDPGHDNWPEGTISHNTVMVDKGQHDPIWVGTPKHFDQTDRVQVMDVEAPKAYDQVETYRRTTAMIAVDDQDSYVVDFFRVDGGDDHHFSFHGMKGPATTTSLDPVPQDGGTYAGPDVPFESSAYAETHDNAFNHLENVARDDDPGERFSVDWDIQDYWNIRDDDADVHLRLTMLEEMDDVALADGHPPQNYVDNPDTFRYMIAHRSGDDLNTTFTSVLEPYKQSQFIESIEEASIVSSDPTARAVKIELTNGRTDYIASASDRTGHVVDDTFIFIGGFAVYSEKNGNHEHAYVHDGKLLIADGDLLIRPFQGRLEGTIESFTKDLSTENELHVKISGNGNAVDIEDTSGKQMTITDKPGKQMTITDTSGEQVNIKNASGERMSIEDAVGEWIYVQTENWRNGAYEINAVTIGKGNRAILHLGEQTTVREFVDPKNPDKGYNYLVSEGASFYIPLSKSWNA